MKNKLHYKILLITDLFNPDKFGGAEVYFYNLIKNLRKKENIILHLICRSYNRNFIRELRIGYWLIPVTSRLWLSILYILLSIISINILLILKRFDVVLINHPLSALYAFFIPKKKKIIIFHSPWCFEYKYRNNIKSWELALKNLNLRGVGYFLRFFIEKQIYSNTKHIVTLSNYMKKICKKLFKTTAIIHVLPPFIDIEEFNIQSDKKSIREKLRISQDKIVFFTARSLIPRTGIDILIKSLYLIKDKIEKCIVLIAGTGNYLSYYEKLVVKYKLQKYVTFLGFLDRKVLIEYFHAVDCFLLPSWKLEGFGLVLLEALYSNLPIIATPVGAIVENLKDIPNCFISSSKSSESFSEQILKFLENFANFYSVDTVKYYLNKYHYPDAILNKILTISGI